jgi:tetratricopeptide (TPR) repeat protein
MPGIGKSTLARALLEFMPVESPPPFWHDFERHHNSGNTLGVLLDRLSSYLENCLGGDVRQEVMSFRSIPEGKASAHDVDILIDYLNQDTPIWLVFDNLETVLARGTNGFLDSDLELLFDGLKNNMHNAKVIVTNPFIPILHDGNFMLEFGTQPLKLEGLDEKSSVEYLRAYGLKEFPEATLLTLARNSDGHPFTLNHIAHYVQAMGATAALDNLQGGLGEITAHFRSSLEHRLSAAEFNALQSLTVLNREISLEGLCRTAQITTATVKRLREEGLLQTNDTEKFWLHNIVRNSLKPEDSDLAKPAHVRALDFYRDQKIDENPASIDDFADVFEWHYHAVQADDVDSAFAALVSTGLDKQLSKWNEYQLLIELCDVILSAMKYSPKGLPRAARIKLYQDLGVSRFYLGEFDQCMENMRAALELVKDTDKPELKLELLIYLAYARTRSGHLSQAMEICRQVFEAMPPSADESLTAKALHLRGNIQQWMGNLEDARNDLEAALQLYEKSNNQLGIGNTTGDLGVVYYFQGEYERAVENYRRAMASCEAQKNMHGVMIGHFNIGDYMLQSGQFETAIREFQMALDLARRKKFRDVELDAGFYLLDAQLSLSLCDEAEAELNRLRPAVQKDSSTRTRGLESVVRARLVWKRGRPGEALDPFRRGLELIDQSQVKDDHSARAHLAFAEYLIETGQDDDAKRALQKAGNLFAEQNNKLGLRTVEKLQHDSE